MQKPRNPVHGPFKTLPNSKQRFAETGSSSLPKKSRWFGSGTAVFYSSARRTLRRRTSKTPPTFSLRKEVIQPQVLLRLPCYDFTPIMNYTLGGCLLAVGSPTSSTTHFRDVTGGVYKARERIHRSVLICDY